MWFEPWSNLFNDLLLPCVDGLELWVSIFGGLTLSCGSKTVTQEYVIDLGNFAFLGICTLAFNNIILLLYIGGKIWPEFLMCAVYFYPHATSPKSYNI